MKANLRFARATGSIFLAAMLMLSVTAQAAQAGPATNLVGVVAGYGYAGYLLTPVGSSLASIGPLFQAGLSCAVSSQTNVATSASLALGTVAAGGALTDRATATYSSSQATLRSESTIANVNLLSGLITADTIHAVVTSTGHLSDAESVNGTSFVNLRVGGISYTPGPNTVVQLAGLGYVVLNEQAGPTNGADATTILVSAIDVHVTTTNGLGLPLGTRIIIARVSSSFQRTAASITLSIGAYGLQVNAANGTVTSGPYATVGLGCTAGSVGASVAAVSIPGIGSTGTISDTANGQVGSTLSSGTGRSTVQQVSLLAGLITADAVTATAQSSWSTTGHASATTSLVNAHIGGVSLAANPGPNTEVGVPGIGYVVLNEQTVAVTSNAAEATVYGLDLRVTLTNPILPVGTRVVIASAHSFIFKH